MIVWSLVILAVSMLYALGIFVFWSAACENRRKYATRIDGTLDLPHRYYLAISCLWPLVIFSRKYASKIHRPLTMIAEQRPIDPRFS